MILAFQDTGKERRMGPISVANPISEYREQSEWNRLRSHQWLKSH